MRVYERRLKTGTVGFRLTMQGTFKCVQNLVCFPFDVQAMTIEIQLGRELHSGVDLSVPNFTLLHDRNEANSILMQVDAEWNHRPVRYRLSRTTPLEGRVVFAKYVAVIPCERDFRFYNNNIFIIPGMLLLMSGGVFGIPVKEKGTRLTLIATIFLVLIAYKFSVSGMLPRVPYYTELDRYMMFCMLGIFFMYMIDIFVRERKVERLWAYASVVVFVAAHVLFECRKRGVRAKELTRIACMGRIDPRLRELLESQGCKLKEDGTLEDPEKYYQMMDDVDDLRDDEHLHAHGGRRASGMHAPGSSMVRHISTLVMPGRDENDGIPYASKGGADHEA